MVTRIRRRGWLIAGLSGLLMLLVWSASVSAAPLVQEEDPIEHVVRAGETLFRIAERYETTIDAIVAANGIADPGHIIVGQKLIIPTSLEESSAVEI